MTNTSAIILALSLLINNVTFLSKTSILEGKNFSTPLVYILSVCLLLREVPILPKFLWARYTSACFLFEIAVSLAVLEYSLVHVWNIIEQYVFLHADELLVQITDKPDLEWLVCHICYGESECSVIFAHLLLKILSFAFLLTVCYLVAVK
ncbi:unnamed protein product [Parnassius mnemosyne]|uniref:Uncharacterized protein n=1 Tax=Parnassius mnemosyne TaxID=213953 RepID=A0AAV1LAK4_9NEOP